MLALSNLRQFPVPTKVNLGLRYLPEKYHHGWLIRNKRVQLPLCYLQPEPTSSGQSDSWHQQSVPVGQINQGKRSAAGLGKLVELEEIKLKTNIKNPFKVIIQSNSGCSSFAHCYIEGIKNTESPKWLKDKLISAGMNPISTVVDITNYIIDIKKLK